ncbi:MAG: methyl-accepting chemotaxis protein [Anaerolineae bacterium]|nr:methyl-accepting chemotaxis protein [Anaerolineae bacterium]
MKINLRFKKLNLSIKKNSIRFKLLSSYLVLIFLVSIGGAFALVQLNSIYTVSEEVNNNTVPSIYLMGQLQLKVNYYLRLEMQHIDASDNQTRTDIADQLNTTGNEIRALITKYKSEMISDKTDEKNINVIEARWRTYEAYSSPILALSNDENDTEAMKLLNGDSTKELAILETALNDASQYNQTLAANMTSTSENTYHLALWLTIAIFTVAFTIALVWGWIISGTFAKAARLLTRAAWEIAETDIPALSHVTDAIAGGDLTSSAQINTDKVKHKSSDELGELADAFNIMIDRLQGMGRSFETMCHNLGSLIGDVSANADELNNASTQLAVAAGQARQATVQISATIQDVARGINQQTESITKTAVSVEQMSRAINGVSKGAQEQSVAITRVSEITGRINQKIDQVAGNARAVTDRSAEAANAAANGSKTVETTLNGMSTIRTKVGISAEKVQDMGRRSGQIGAIVETIEDIASQTNMLALNAAIEAARAGEHGKGFAVVADEVRKLAERSSTATKEIGKLVKDIQNTVNEAVQAMEEGAREVEQGFASANEAGQALSSILETVDAVYKQAQQAAQATDVVRNESNELVGSIDTVSSVVEENTAATEQMSANSSEVTQSVEAIASVSEENSAAVEEVSASTEEMNAQVEEVTRSAQTLADMAVNLRQLVSRFRI